MRKKSTNSQTAASKLSRMKTAHAYEKKMQELGLITRTTLRLKTEVFEDFERLAEQLDVSRPECLRILLENYRLTQGVD